MKLLVIVILFLSSTLLFADTYKYIDKDGIINFTSDIKDIPHEYRNKVEVIKEEKEQIKDISPVKRQASKNFDNQNIDNKIFQKEETPKQFLEKNERFFVQEIILLIISSLFFLFANKILFFIENKKVITISRFAIILIVLIFLFSKFIDKQVATFLEAKQDINKIKKSLETKDVKIDKIVK